MNSRGAVTEQLAVVIPMLNEAPGVEATLRALARQRDTDFAVVVVDNGSTDGSAEVVGSFIERHALTTWRVIAEPQKGTGAAADTGFRAAIEAGASIVARTDADCLPRPDWTAAVRRALTPSTSGGDGLVLLGGHLIPRRDEGLPWWRRRILTAAVEVAGAFGRVRPGNRDASYLGPYIMAPGCTMAIRAETYLAVGGFPRTAIEELHEDRALVNAVRKVSTAYAYRRDAVVASSSRRVQAWGLVNTLRWYADHSWRGETVDIRSTRQSERTGGEQRWERRVLRAAHPIAYPLLDRIPGPVRKVPGLGVIVKDATLLRAVLMDSDHFTKNGPGAPSDLWTPILGPSVLLNMDGAEHAALRRTLTPLFSPSAVESIVAASLAAPLAEVTAALDGGQSVDLVAHATRCARAVIGHLVGIPDGAIDDDLFARMSAITGFVSLARPTLTPSQVKEARAVLAELGTFAAAAYAGDATTVPGRMRELGLSEREALGAVGAFVLTGTETLISYVPRMLAIWHDAGWWPRLVGSPELVESAIAEALRVSTPTPMMLRSTTAATTIGEVEVKAGERVLLGTWWADNALGPLDVERNVAATMKQLWFGAGSHFCLGGPLALAQIRLTADVLLERGDLRIVSRTAKRNTLIPSYASLTIARGGRS